jgi:hypothetical protein
MSTRLNTTACRLIFIRSFVRLGLVGIFGAVVLPAISACAPDQDVIDVALNSGTNSDKGQKWLEQCVDNGPCECRDFLSRETRCERCGEFQGPRFLDDRECHMRCSRDELCLQGCPFGHCEARVDHTTFLSFCGSPGMCRIFAVDAKSRQICPGGHCETTCIDSTCTQDCGGGSCKMSCSAGSECEILRCTQGCTIECEEGSQCTVSCSADEGCGVEMVEVGGIEPPAWVDMLSIDSQPGR